MDTLTCLELLGILAISATCTALVGLFLSNCKGFDDDF